MTTTPTFPEQLGRVARGLWRGLDAARRVLLNLLLLAVLLLAGVAAWWALKPAPSLEPKTTLVLALQGQLVEQIASTNPRQRLRGAVMGASGGVQTALRDVVAALDAAARDEQIPHVLLVLDEFGGGSLPVLRELSLAIGRVRAAGKPVWAWGADYGQAAWFLAAHADEVWLHPEGSVWVEGYGRRRSHYRELFDKLGVQAHVLRAGRYKNAMEPYSAARPSAETLESEGAIWNGLWQSYTSTVEKARKLPAGSVARAIDSLPGSLQQRGGDPAKWALAERWVDQLLTRDQLRAELEKRGVRDEQAKTFRQIGLGAYLARIDRDDEHGGGSAGRVGIVIAQGGIVDGRAGPGTVGGLSTAELVKRAREDEQIKAIVLRVDSPGGSAFGSELVRRELQLAREAGKPVVVSMGGLAASGGYWISMAADEVIADEATITGSIGVVGMLPSAAVAFERLGVHAEGVTTTWLRNQPDARMPLDPRFAGLVQAVVDGGYQQFLGLVAQARGKTTEQVHTLAQGRVWTGRDALAHGLVDRLGGFDDAVASAARRARIEGQPVRRYLEAPRGRLDRWLDRFGLAQLSMDLTAEWQHLGTPAALAPLAPLATAAAPLAAELADLQQLLMLSKSPAGAPAALAHCLCAAE